MTGSRHPGSDQAAGPIVLDGVARAGDLRRRLNEDAARLSAGGRPPALAVVAVGDDPSARSYLRGIERAAGAAGVEHRVHRLPAEAGETDVVRLVDELAADPEVHGIALQSPLPPGLDMASVGARIPRVKDVDGANPESAGRLLVGLPAYAPATALAVLDLAHLGPRALPGARAVVVGRSAVVGKPVAVLLLAEHATVTVCHSRTADLAAVTREADVLVVAAGRARFVTGSHVSPGTVVIDVGINAGDGGIVGDVDYDAVAPVAAAITPVPGGVGPLTTTMLMSNTVAAAKASASR